MTKFGLHKYVEALKLLIFGFANFIMKFFKTQT